MPWVHPGFVWKNSGYESFNDFPARFKSSRRKSIRQERRRLTEHGVDIRVIAGTNIQEKHMAWMYGFYSRTNLRYFPWSCKYLTADFFHGLPQRCGEHIILFAAHVRGREEPVGMSMLVRKGKCLFGRYWGGLDRVPFLHFNLCYYEPIEWAIEHGIEHFDPGMVGEHKLYRGFELVPNYSLHKMYASGMQGIMAMSLREFNALQRQRILELNQELPMKKTPGSMGIAGVTG